MTVSAVWIPKAEPFIRTSVSSSASAMAAQQILSIDLWVDMAVPHYPI